MFLGTVLLAACGSPETVVPGTPAPLPSSALAAIATTPSRAPFARAPVVATTMPSSAPIVRPECFPLGHGDLGLPQGGFGGGGRKGQSVGRAGGAPNDSGGTPSQTRFRPMPSPRPPPPAAPLPPQQKPAKEPKAERGPPAMDLPASAPAAAEPTVAGDGLLDARLQDPHTVIEELEQEEDKSDRRTRDETGESLDFGATVWLSNDDSMSLASAQRVLWALDRGARLEPSEIRPHELLNYFSFDSVAPPPGETFGVLGAAEQDGDTLTVSLAVRGANPPRQPLDLTLLVDRSCSMEAEGRMDFTKRGLSMLSDQLQAGDRVDLVLFDSAVCTPLENFVVGRDDPSLLASTIAKVRPNSGTNLEIGMDEAYRVQTSRPQSDTHGRNRRVLLITDALLNEGAVEKGLVAKVAGQLDENDIRVSAIGVGRQFDDAVLDELTEVGRGGYVYLGSEAVVDRVFGPGFDALVRTVAHDVHFALELPPSLAMRRFYGEESSTVKADVKPIHYHAGTTQLFLQDLAIRGGRVAANDELTLRIEWRDAITDEPMEQELRTTVGALLEGDAHNLHKGHALMGFADWAVATSLGADACGAPLAAYLDRASLTPDDAELAYVTGLVAKRCPVAPSRIAEVAAVRRVPLKVRVDSDIPISSVDVTCGRSRHRASISPADTIARFAAVEPGTCAVELAGQTPLLAELEVPSTGADVRCLVRGGRLVCS